MEIKEINIDGFGIYNQFSLALPGKGIHIFLGENEAGKSTLLKFLRYTLFGYPRQLEQRMPPLRGGNHAGRVKALMANGDEATFERDGKDKIKLVCNNSETTDPTSWNQLMGNASADLFNKVYAFTLDELIDLSSLQASGMEDKLFSLGLGLGNVSLFEIEKNISRQTDEIYKSRGKSAISLMVEEIKESRGQIQQIQNHINQYKELESNIKTLEKEVNVESAGLVAHRKELAKYEVLLRCYDAYLAFRRADEALTQLPPLAKLPENGVQLMERALEQKTEITEKLRQIEDGTIGQPGLSTINRQLNETEVNAGWLENSEKIEYIRLNLARYQQAVKERMEESDRLKQLDASISQTITSKINDGWNEQDVAAFGNIPAHESRLEQFTTALQKITDEKRDWESQEKALMSQQGTFNTQAIARLLSLVFALGSAPLFYYRLFFPATVLLVIALVFLVGQRAFVKSNPLKPIRQKIKQLAEEEAALIEKYRLWLHRELKLSPQLSFDATKTAFQTIGFLKDQVIQRDRLRQKIQQERLPYIYDYEGKVNGLKEHLAKDPGSEQIELVALSIISEWDKTKMQLERIKKMAGELERLKNDQQLALSKLQQTGETIENLFSAAQVSNAEEFFGLYRINNQIENQTGVRQSAIEKIETVAGFGKSSEIISLLMATDKPSLEIKTEELKQTVLASEQNLARLHNLMGAATKEKERISGQSELSMAMTELEIRKQNLHNLYKDWLAGQVALKILGTVKGVYEREKQPSVIRNASGFFNQITGGVYTGLRASIEGRDVAVVDKAGVSRTINQLSRGTREQLMVCLRLGYIQEYETRSEPLPVIVDEVMVNFDPARARKAAKVLHSFAANRQVLLFTCHPNTIELFQNMKINVVKINNGIVV